MAAIAAWFGSTNTTAITSVASSTAVKTRSRTNSAAADLSGGEPEAALPAPVVTERPLELLVVEVGPQHVTEIELRVCEIPQQEVADAMLAAGADEQIRVRHG